MNTSDPLGSSSLEPAALEPAAVAPAAEMETIMVGSLIGHYQILSTLGKGGMGTVYLAMHLGTRRYVALKVIAPRLMAQQEFVARFRREAEAAGSLRHPNVVDVTDFGFARLGETDIAYLVMEYLDGCTLADVLAEEVRLPLMWVVDILEQACSAVEEAHQQGTIHRDLKPENIWLEPNRRGGYTVKVLDFGLAKLATASPVEMEQAALEEIHTYLPQKVSEDAITLALPPRAQTGEAKTTRDAALLISPADGLTRVGALLGTPHYMSPEQCRGQIPGPQSDIYSLGVIAYQMLSGRTPFTGDLESVIRSHLEAPATSLHEASPKIPKKVAALIMSALAKNPADRPESAAAFANALRACAEGPGMLLRRTFAIYSEHLPTFLRLSAFSYLPAIAIGLLLFGNYLLMRNGAISNGFGQATGLTLNALFPLVNLLCNIIASGLIIPIVIQVIVVPLRPIQSRAAFALLRRRLRPFITTTIITFLLFIAGLIFCIVPGLIIFVMYALCGPVVMIEGLKNFEAMRRSHTLVGRAPGTVTLILLTEFAIPEGIGAIIGGYISRFNKEIPEFAASLKSILIAFANVPIIPLMIIGIVMLYLKTRQAGGETINDTLAHFEAEEAPRRKWQMRMRERLPKLDRSSYP
jgi:serine/threonine protein kinase